MALPAVDRRLAIGADFAPGVNVNSKIPCWLACLGLIMLLAGCATTTPVVMPSLTTSPTGLRDSGRIISHELATLDLALSKAFYETVFGWTFQNVDGSKRSYSTISHGGRIIGGAFEFDQSESQQSTGEWIPVISISEVGAMAEKTRNAGGVVIAGPRDLPDWGNGFLARDPQEAVFFALNTTHGDPQEPEPMDNLWLWNELWTSDLDASLSFYNSVFAYDSVKSELGKGLPYRLFRNGNQTRGGVMQIEDDGVRPHWVPFIKVADVGEAFAKAVDAGARVLLAPNQDIRDGTAALVLDPGGAPIALQEFNR